ncbi:gluconate kinase (SKI family) [Modicisalibacter xianhensis]|uniref:Gluconokinase n=1 Tax=Modicisalibacter xianhensis TaxID=442341 RepID=A0A4V3GV16_9GAMM|nr:gluconokinase [Halomonas xianhensis]TDX33076.1 gluconate kinase (SKI family) [Halomonas xianhensis]
METSPKCILVMGVSGSGKSHIGRALAKELGCHFIDGDDHHSANSIAKMSRGEPLSDDDRKDWLVTLSGFYRDYHYRGESVVIGCSALKKRYRDVLRQGAPELEILYLHGSRETLLQRLTSRDSHFFHGEHMLDSQLEALEIPLASEAWQIDIRQPPEDIVERYVIYLRDNRNA